MASLPVVKAETHDADAEKLAALFDNYARRMALYARQWVSAAETDDLVQDVFVRLVAQRHMPEDPAAWLFRSMRNAAISRLRSNKRRSKREAAAIHQDDWFDDDPGDLMDSRAATEQLTSLDEQQREIVILHIWAGMTFQQIAEVIGVSKATAFRHYKHALGTIKQQMEQSCKTNQRI